jgi:hypothetical protein
MGGPGPPESKMQPLSMPLCDVTAQSSGLVEESYIKTVQSKKSTFIQSSKSKIIKDFSNDLQNGSQSQSVSHQHAHMSAPSAAPHSSSESELHNAHYKTTKLKWSAGSLSRDQPTSCPLTNLSQDKSTLTFTPYTFCVGQMN